MTSVTAKSFFADELVKLILGSFFSHVLFFFKPERIHFSHVAPKLEYSSSVDVLSQAL